MQKSEVVIHKDETEFKKIGPVLKKKFSKKRKYLKKLSQMG